MIAGPSEIGVNLPGLVRWQDGLLIIWQIRF